LSYRSPYLLDGVVGSVVDSRQRGVGFKSTPGLKFGQKFSSTCALLTTGPLWVQ